MYIWNIKNYLSNCQVAYCSGWVSSRFLKCILYLWWSRPTLFLPGKTGGNKTSYFWSLIWIRKPVFARQWWWIIIGQQSRCAFWFSSVDDNLTMTCLQWVKNNKDTKMYSICFIPLPKRALEGQRGICFAQVEPYLCTCLIDCNLTRKN